MMNMLLVRRKLLYLAGVAVFCATIRMSAWLTGEPWTRLVTDWSGRAFLLATGLALTVLAVVERRQARTRAERRLQAALDAYAEREITRELQRRTSRPGISTW